MTRDTSAAAECDKSPQEIRREREQRITDAIGLRGTDRVPVTCGLGFFVARYAGIPCSACYYDWDAWLHAYRVTLRDFQPDLAFVLPCSPGKAMERLAPKHARWAGYGLDIDNGFQAIEVDCLPEDEYDHFLSDPSDFMLRRYMPRRFGSTEFLGMLPDLSGISWLWPSAAEDLAMLLTESKVEEAIKNLQEAGREFRRYRVKFEEFQQLMAEYGMPQMDQGGLLPPFDLVSHTIRGMKGTTVDMYRQPDKLLEACDLVLKKSLEKPFPKPNEYGNLRMYVTNTRGTDDCMSKKQFDTFYWPTFKTLILTMIERGGTPCIFLEGNFTSKLEYLLEFPRGKFAIRLDTTDIFRAKEVLRDHCCIEGNVPSSLLQLGTVTEVTDCCRKLIDVVGKGGGYILGPRSSTDTVKPENLKAMIEFTKEYGRYC